MIYTDTLALPIYTACNKLFYCTGEPSGVVSDILEQCICSMKAGEKCELEIAPLTLRDSLPALSIPEHCSRVVYSLRLVSFERGKDVWRLTDDERFEIATKLKTLGTEKFKAGDVKLAAIFYSRAVKYIIPVDLTEQDPQQLTQDVRSLRIRLFLNLAACQLKFKQYDHAARNCTKVLELDQDCVKALYRRGQAYINLNDFEQARNDLVKAKHLEPNSQAIFDAQLNVLESKIRSQNAKYRDMLRTMFDSKP